jgi:DNA-binding response OmpR family regulator
MATVLVVEDERDIREVLRRFLERAGHSVLTARTGAEGLRLIDRSEVDLVLLDLGLPDIDGIDILREVSDRLPVVVLTARSDTQDRITGLRLGADDYIVKPFSPTEVVLRVRAVLARTNGHETSGTSRTYGDGALMIDPARHVATCRGDDLHLTVSEWELLATLAHSPGRVFTRAELINRVRGYEFEGYERTIDSHVKNLRHKLCDDEHRVVQTVVGVGYRFGLAPDA